MTPPGSGDRPGADRAEPGRRTVAYPGGLSARYRWTGPDGAASLQAASEAGGRITELGTLIGGDASRLCTAELRMEGPTGSWTTRFASPIHDEPSGVFWDTHGLLVMAYGFEVYALAARSGALRWRHRSGTPMVSVLASSRLPHVVAQSELETFALREDGEAGWRIAHGDVVTDAQLVAGHLVLTMYTGVVFAYDPLTGAVVG